MDGSIAPFYGDWRLYNDLVVEGLRGMAADELALAAPSSNSGSSTHWPIWAIAGHTAGTRVYWLCKVMGVPGVEATPFAGMGDEGWEDDLDHPRTADELVTAWTSTSSRVEPGSPWDSWASNASRSASSATASTASL